MPISLSFINLLNLQKVLFISLFLYCYRVYAQIGLSHFDYLTITESLPHNTVFCLMQDKYGFIWAGTKDGLVRYDGYACRVFRQSENDTSYFQGKSIHALLEDSKGNLWVGTQTNGINLRDVKTGVFRNLQDNPLFKPISKKWINCFFEDKNGKIWIGTIGAGLWCFDPKSNQMRHFDRANSQLKDNNISDISQDENGRIWVAGSGNGIYFFEDKESILHQIHATEVDDSDFASFRKVFFPDKKGNLWVATKGSGLYQVNLSTLKTRCFSIKNGLTSNNIMSIAQNKQGELLLATDGGGLNVFNPQTTNVYSVRYGKNQGNLNSDALFSVLIDQDENVWIGSFNGGINISKAHKTRFESFTQTGTKDGELSHRSVLSIYESKNGQIYVGTDGGGLNLFNKNTKTFSLINSQPTGYRNVVKTIFEDSKKNIWLGYFENGLSIFEPKSRRFKHFRHNPNDATSIGANNVWSIAEDLTGKIWVGILGGGLARLDDSEKSQFKRFSFQPNNSKSLSSDDVIVVFADRNNQLWVGTDTEGLNLFNQKTESFTRFQHQKGNPKSLSANDVRCIFQDSKSRLWIGTESGGLNLWLGKGDFEHFTTKNGLISNAIMNILEDKDGFLWISTFKGVSRFSVDTKQCLNYDFNKNSYLNANQFNQASGIKAQSGTILFGGINGLTFIKPDEIRILGTKPKLVITDFKIFNQSIQGRKLSDGRVISEKNLEETSEIHLLHSDNAFSFEFAALDFTDPLKNQYTYKMDGFDENWRVTNGEQRLITYTNLEPATYTLRVKGSNNNGVWSEEKTIKIMIEPPFWKTWWFKTVILVVLLGLAWLTLHIYTTRREMVLRQKVLESDRSILSLKNENLIAESKILQLQKEKLSTEIDTRNSELVSKTIQMAHKKEILEDLKEKIDDIKNAKDADKGKLLSNLKSTLATEIEGENSWTQFLFYFDQVNHNFTTELLKKHQSLTQNDLRMCALTRLNMSNKEKAVLLNVTVTGVEKSRYRLKKRLNLNPDDDLVDYLRKF